MNKASAESLRDEGKKAFSRRAFNTAFLGRAERAFRAAVRAYGKEQYGSAETYFRKADELGHKSAAKGLADIYFERGRSGGFAFLQPTRDELRAADEAFEWAMKGAENGDGEAMVILAACFRDGVGTEVDREKAREWNRKAADAGCSIGAYNAGADFYNAGDFDNAEKYFLMACELGYDLKRRSGCSEWITWGLYLNNIPAGLITTWHRKSPAGMLAEIYFRRVPADARAFEWAKKGAEAGDGDAMLILADCFRAGLGTAADEKNAQKCYVCAADAMNAEGAYKAGLCFRRQENFKKAAMYFSMADTLRHKLAMGALAELYFAQNPTDERAWTWARRGTEVDDPLAFRIFGILAWRGCGMERSREKAFECWRKGAALGDAPCADFLENPPSDSVPATDSPQKGAPEK